MELKEMKAFVTVARVGGFTAAAEVLDVQKSHISRVINNLEKKLGCRLLERTTRAISLTEVGHEVYKRAQGILEAVEETRDFVQTQNQEPVGLLKLTCGVEFGALVVSQWIRDYLNRYPEVRVEADFTARRVDLVDEGYDVAVRLGQSQDSSLAMRPLGYLRYGLFAAPDYLEQKGRPNHPDQLQDHQLLAFTLGHQRKGWQLSRDGHACYVDLAKVRPRMALNNSLTLRDAAMEGMGITRLPYLLVYEQVEAGRLVPLLSDWEHARVQAFALFQGRRYMSAKVRCFLDQAVDSFSKMNAAQGIQ